MMDPKSADIAIQFLADIPDAIPTLARWLFDEWGHRSEDGTAEGMRSALERRLNRSQLPLTLVALVDNRPVGTVSLKIREVEIRPEMTHWLGALYVQESRRGRGVGTTLVEAAEREAHLHGIEDLYLYTRQQQTEDWYAWLGWKVVERLLYQGRSAVIMTRDLSAAGA